MTCLVYSITEECPCCPSYSGMCPAEVSVWEAMQSAQWLLSGQSAMEMRLAGPHPRRHCLVAVVVVFSFCILSFQGLAPDSAGADSTVQDAWEDEFFSPSCSLALSEVNSACTK